VGGLSNEPVPFKPGQDWAPDFDRSREVFIVLHSGGGQFGILKSWCGFGVHFQKGTWLIFYPWASISHIEQDMA
jgi:hypothetical protein